MPDEVKEKQNVSCECDSNSATTRPLQSPSNNLSFMVT